jgi:DNA mismatch repair protein MutH
MASALLKSWQDNEQENTSVDVDGDEFMKMRTALKAGKLATNHNEALQVRTGLQGGKKRGLVVRAGVRAGRRAAW